MKINFFYSSNYKTGGQLYNLMVFESLKKKGYNISLIKSFTNYRGRGHSYVDAFYSLLLNSSKKNEIDIMDYTKSAFVSRFHKGKRIIIFHHYDPLESNKSKKNTYYFKKFLKNAQNATVVVVSEYWKNFLENAGLKDVRVIYNSFNIEDYKVPYSKNEFYKKFNLPNKPIIYIGKNCITKTLSTYNALKPLEKNFLIVTSGFKKEFAGPIFLNVNLNDYKSLLHNSIATVLFTEFSEGWSRIAHESLLLGTPVIGNGSGGMEELLNKTNQNIYSQIDIFQLSKLLNDIHSNKKRVSEKDIKWLANLNEEYFINKWEKLIMHIDN